MWYLIENNSQKLLKFSSEARLKTYAKEKNLYIRKSPLDNKCYYTTSYAYVPARQERQA